MDPPGILVALADQLCGSHAQCKGQDGNQIVQNHWKFSLTKMLTQQNNVTRLGIGKYTPSGNIGIGILEASRHRQKGSGQERFGHLFLGSICVHNFSPNCNKCIGISLSLKGGKSGHNFLILCI